MRRPSLANTTSFFSTNSCNVGGVFFLMKPSSRDIPDGVHPPASETGIILTREHASQISASTTAAILREAGKEVRGGKGGFPLGLDRREPLGLS